MDNTWMLLVCFVVLVSCCSCADDERAIKLKPVTAALHTQWAQTPLIMEAAEFFYDENPGMFWSFVDRLRDVIGTKSRTWTEKEQHDVAISIGLQLLSPVKQNFLTFAMALRYYSPRIEMYRQILLSEVSTPKGCKDVLVDFGGGLVSCGVKEFADTLQTFDASKTSDRKNPKVISVDHQYPGSSSSATTVMVYGNLLSPVFYQVHELIMSENTDFRFVFRHHLDAISSSHYSKVRIPGYGVELAIKSTEYKAQDDRKIKEGEAGDQAKPEEEAVDDELDTDIEGFDFGKLKSRFPQKKDQLEQMKSFLLQSTGTELQQLKAWQFQDLSLQAAERALKVAALHTGSATDALRTVRDISQNFPSQAPTLLRIPVQELVKAEIERNREYFAHYHNLEHGSAALFINGIQYDTDLLDTFALFDKLREENRLMESLHSFGIHGSDLSAVLELDLRPTESAKYGVDIRHPAVVWINDLEKDKRYADWPSSPRELIRQSFPPTLLKPIRRNFYNLILVVNPANVSDSRDILKLTESFYVHRLPIRMGVIFVTNSDAKIDGTTDASVAIYNSFKHITEQKNGATALSFLTDLYTKAVKDGQVVADEVVKYFKQKYPQENPDAVLGPDSVYNSGRNDGRQFIEKLNIGEPPLVLLNGVQLDKSKLTADEFENEVLQNLVGVYSVLQRDVMSGQLTDHSNVIEYLMAKPHIVPRLNSLILDPPEFRFLEFGGKSLDPEKYTFANFEALKAEDRTATMVATSFYLVKHEEEEAHPVTMWVVADAETPAGRELMYNMVKHSKTSKNVRVAFIFNPSETESIEKGMQLTKAIQVALETQSMNLARNFITKLLKEENVAEIATGTKIWEDFEVNGMDMKAFTSGLKELSSDFLKIHSLFAREELNLSPGENVLIANGYIVGPVKSDFGMDDIALLEKYIESYGATKLSNELHRLNIFRTADQLSDAVMMTSTLLSGLGSQEEAKKRTKVQYSEMAHSVINIEQRDTDSPSFDITFIVDPVSREAQKIIPVLMVLHEALNCRVRVFFNCKDKLSELPLKSFYRMVLEAKLTFTENGSIAPNYALARFPALPQTALLTMNLQAPDNWLTEATSAVYDLDNIRLTELVDGWGIHGGFELVNLLLEGSAKDAATDQPPRGTQFVLGTRNQPEYMDTIVMANLGYFQLKANPGAWILKLREGRSHEIYSIASAEGAEKEGSDEEQQRVVIGSFNTKMMKIYVKKRPGMEREDVLSEKKDAVESEAGIFNSISSYWSKDEHKSASASDDVINIFSLASGHLYERFLRIMMLSVVKNTKTPVKFWLLRNYLSPQFKEIIPYMAEHYGFEYELVEYKWPRWLNQQSEKQRIIWGYKILFLDVLFPLSVKKIIFVDADQIVRTDLKELRDFDLEGAPYGYTPFCESRQDMDGFRFWKNGYWASHLGNRKYHISALYVVDLARFRKIAAGDRLRAQYQGLSQDPNSLSNLDQDLPNNMIYQVPIKSLPQEWLWCETWCDEASKAKAKTIDLCNNPLTKEPKLASAMRIVPEWNTYDQEIKRLIDEFYAVRQLTIENAGEPVLREAVPEDTFGGNDADNEIPVHSTGHTHEHGDEL